MAFGIGIGPKFINRVVVSGTGGFDADYQSVLTYATSLGYTLPSAGQQVKQNQLMLGLKSSGAWSKLDTFAMFATDGSSDFALIDWKRLTTYTAVNSPMFTSNGGFTGNGTSSYIDTNFNPATQGANYTLNNAGRYYLIDNIGNITCEGNSVARNSTINSNTAAQRINQDSTLQSASINYTVSAFRGINRTSNSNCTFFSNLTQTNTVSASVSVVSANQYVLRSATNYGSSRFRFYAMGASLVSENTAFYNAINTYMTSL